MKWTHLSKGEEYVLLLKVWERGQSPDYLSGIVGSILYFAFVAYTFFFYKNNLYKKHQAEIRPKNKNNLRNKAG